MIDALAEALLDAECPGRVEWYPGTEHGFTFRERGPLHVKDASERHWERLHDLFTRNLKP